MAEVIKKYLIVEDGAELDKKRADKDFKNELFNNLYTSSNYGTKGVLKNEIREDDTIEQEVLDQLFDTFEEANKKLPSNTIREMHYAIRYYDVQAYSVYSVEIASEVDENNEYKVLKLEDETGYIDDLVKQFKEMHEDNEQDDKNNLDTFRGESEPLKNGLEENEQESCEN